MDNVFSYLDWRGDLDLESSNFNTIDALILTRLSYIPFDNIVSRNFDESISIKEAYNKSFEVKNFEDGYILANDKNFFKALANSKRFKNMRLSAYINDIDLKTEKQFSAITIDTFSDDIFVAYRGTDDTLVGWKEDFNMSFLDEVPAQIDAKNYLENIANKTNLHLTVSGHSKGGNLGVYAASFCSKEIQNRILNVFNFDGPGLSNSLVKKEGYQNILNKIHTFVPQSSVVGILLEHEEKYSIVNSYEKGIRQHDLFSWQIMQKDFVYLNKVTNDSVFVDETLRDWLSKVNKEQRTVFFDTLYSILDEMDIDGAKEIVTGTNRFKTATTVLLSLKDLDQETRDMVIGTFKVLLESAKINLKITNPKLASFFGFDK